MEANPIDDLYGFSPIKSEPRELPEPDLYIITSDGLRIPAHSSILVPKKIQLLIFFN